MATLTKFKSKSIQQLIKIFLDRILKTRIDTFHYLTLDIKDKQVERLEIEKFVKKLSLKDFEHNSIQLRNKFNLIENRLNSKEYVAYGIFEDGKLVYSTWISQGKITMPNGDCFPIKDDEAILEDSYCSPQARGKGYHSKMNLFRINEIVKEGKKKIIAIVLEGNDPAMKVQTKSGFKEEFYFKSGTIFGYSFTTKLKK